MEYVETNCSEKRTDDYEQQFNTSIPANESELIVICLYWYGMFFRTF